MGRSTPSTTRAPPTPWHSVSPPTPGHYLDQFTYAERATDEGIGRPRVEPSFMPGVIDRMVPVADAASIGAMRALSKVLGRDVGGSTGTNLVACLATADGMRREGTRGSIVTLLCDGGDRYACTYYDDAWLARKGVMWEAEARKFASALG